MSTTRQTWRARWRGFRLCRVLLLLCALLAALPAAGSAQAAATRARVTTTIFYPATKAAYDAWNTTTSTARPPKTTTFPSGTKTVAFYFEYEGATANTTQYEIIIHAHTGSAFVIHGPYVLQHGAGLHMSPVDAPTGKAYPDGAYHADLLIDGRVVLGIDFTVGNPSSIAVTAFYPATSATYNNWVAATTPPAPPRTAAFPSGTTTVAFYTAYNDATPKATQYLIVVRDSGGARVVTHGPYVFSYKTGFVMSKVASPHGAYPDGTYSADLLISGRVAATARFTVGSVGSGGLTVLTFYTATRAAYDAWNATNSTADPPRTDTFPAGTTQVAFYFHYRGAIAKSTQFSLVVHTAAGGTFQSVGPYTLAYANGYEMDRLRAPNHGAYPGGTYAADLFVSGRLVATAHFTVRSTSAAIATVLYAATKAAYDAWNNSTSTARPPRTNTFRVGTSGVALYFEYKGAIAKSTQYQLVIRGPSGGVFTAYGPYALRYSSALSMRYVVAPHNGTYPTGAYHVDLLLDGRLAASTDFIVRSQGVSIATFYAASKAAYDAWTNTTSTARPPKTTAFPRGTSVVTFYFEYKGAAANTTRFEIVIRNQQGATVATHGPFTMSLGAALHMSKMDPPAGGAYPSGAYRADLLVAGQVAASTFFSVGATGGSITPPGPACHASDVVATCIEPSVLRLHANLPNNMMSEGTGFVIRSDGTGTYLLTNKHVVDGATARTMVAIAPDGHTTYPVLAIVANDAEEGSAGDLAVVKLPPTALRPLPWGNSDGLHLMQQVVSIGYGDAFELPGPPSVTVGTISALHRDLGDGYGAVWIQHQSFINHGNSGGPLLDMHFNVVGVNDRTTAKQTQGIFFAIPASTARQIAQRLMSQM